MTPNGRLIANVAVAKASQKAGGDRGAFLVDGSFHMRQQLALEFDTQEEAVAYAQKHGIAHQVYEPQVQVPRPKSYSDNFRFDRKQPWSH